MLEEGKQINVLEKYMVISPYAMLWHNDHYYLVGNNEWYDNLIHLRIDRMRKVEITDIGPRHFREVSPYRDVFDVADYAAKIFNMYGGELKKIELKCSKSKIEQIVDRFSYNIMIFSVTDTSFNFSTDAIISDGLISWILQFGDDVEAVSPIELRNAVRQRLESLCEVYGISQS